MKAKENAIKTSEARRKPGNVELQVLSNKMFNNHNNNNKSNNKSNRQKQSEVK